MFAVGRIRGKAGGWRSDRICFMPWYRVTLNHQDIAGRKHIAMQRAFEAVFAATGAPKDAGLYKRDKSQVYEYYFSPGAAKIAKSLIVSYSGVECAAPARSELVPLAEHVGSGDVAFRPET
jgi:hypothetical protein